MVPIFIHFHKLIRNEENDNDNNNKKSKIRRFINYIQYTHRHTDTQKKKNMRITENKIID